LFFRGATLQKAPLAFEAFQSDLPRYESINILGSSDKYNRKSINRSDTSCYSLYRSQKKIREERRERGEM
jgi:hypothetical protein